VETLLHAFLPHTFVDHTHAAAVLSLVDQPNAEHMGGNLLKREVTAAEVAQAFVALAKTRATTGHVATVDGGNIAAALR
jgi:rhamnose utilization protein RhaD (predicted bifunctional aldolase and dehydrogenase)